MKKMIKLLSIGALTSITSLQAVACTDDSQYKTFLSDVNNSKAKRIAIFGFLGSKDDPASQTMFNAFNYWQNSAATTFNTWKNTADVKTAMNKVNITDIQLESFQGASHQSPQSVSDFWNDKSISWQRDIFSWIVDNSNQSTNASYANPLDLNSTSKQVDTSSKDGNGKTMFTALPIFFFIVNGNLYSAAQGWVSDTSSNPNGQISYMQSLIYGNIFSRVTDN